MNNFLQQIVPILIPNRLRPHVTLGPKISKITGNQVAVGPFKGMKYISDSVGSVFIPKILGTYELELAPLVEKLCQMSFDTVIDIGAAEGYYAVGMAKSLAGAKVVAYELNPQGRALMKRMAELNGVENRVIIRGLCEAASLADDLEQGKKTLMIMDIEGSEGVFLDPFIFPALEKTHILVELHDFAIEGVGSVISRRFSDTHNITEIAAKERTIQDFPLPLAHLGPKLPSFYVARVMSEHRPPGMRWFYLEPKTGNTDSTSSPD